MASQSKIVEISRKYQVVYQYPQTPNVITQEDLAEVAILRQKKRDIEALLKKKRFLIRFGLEHGAQIEPGMRSARVGKKLVVA